MPANAKHLQGDFSDMLQLPEPDAVPHLRSADDAARSGEPRAGMIRDPFPNNIIPRDRIFNPDGTYKNPLMGLYAAIVPPPNQNFLSPTQAADRQLLPGERAERAGQPSLRRALRLQPLRSRPLLLPRQRQQFTRTRRLDVRIADAAVSRPAQQRSRALTWSYTGNWTH